MNIDLTRTTTRRIADTMQRARHAMGGPTTGMVLTLVIVTDESAQYDAVRAAAEVAREHPCRVLAVIARGGRAESRLDAEIRLGETGPGETVLLRMYGQLADHADSVVSPLLVPDTPVVTWWPGRTPKAPATEPLGALALRRVTDCSADDEPMESLVGLAEQYRPGDTDFAWTRLTPWRTLLAATLDQPHAQITGGSIEAEWNNPSGILLAGWLAIRLGVAIGLTSSDGPGITAARIATSAGELAITRPDGRVATLSRPGQPDRRAALQRREVAELLAEELRRLDPDEVYRDTILHVADALHGGVPEIVPPGLGGSSEPETKMAERGAVVRRADAAASAATEETAHARTEAASADVTPEDSEAAETAEDGAR